jgi:hypothetical protein
MLLQDPPVQQDRGPELHNRRPRRPRRFRRPSLLVELVLVPIGYLAYAAVRNARGQTTPAKTRLALLDAKRLIRLEQVTGLWHEHTIQKFLMHAPTLIKSLDVFYATAHFIVTLVVLVFVYVWAPVEYPKLRTALGVATVLGLIGFALFPVLPPRLLPPDRGFVDTLQRLGGLWSFKTPVIERISDPFAAMPSLHLAWASWCTVAIWRSVKNRGVRVAAIVYPLISALTVLGTANHYILDIAAGVAVTAMGLAVAELPARVRAKLAARRATRIAAAAAAAGTAGRQPRVGLLES